METASASHTPVYVLIRSRGGDFILSDDDMLVMAEDIRQVAKLGASGVVFGALCQDGSVDTCTTQALLKIARDQVRNDRLHHVRHGSYSGFKIGID